jgi:hypothetical protein
MTYTITIHDDFFNKTFTGTFTGKTKYAAISRAREMWAHELDCTPEDIEVVSVEIEGGRV